MYLSSFSLVLSLKKKTGKADQVKKFGLEGKELERLVSSTALEYERLLIRL